MRARYQSLTPIKWIVKIYTIDSWPVDIKVHGQYYDEASALTAVSEINQQGGLCAIIETKEIV